MQRRILATGKPTQTPRPTEQDRAVCLVSSRPFVPSERGGDDRYSESMVTFTFHPEIELLAYGWTSYPRYCKANPPASQPSIHFSSVCRRQCDAMRCDATRCHTMPHDYRNPNDKSISNPLQKADMVSGRTWKCIPKCKHRGKSNQAVGQSVGRKARVELGSVFGVDSVRRL
ncbi:hypothetical protein LY76DRAFT_56463 [Colletotrichum caudatum]|nr:hypothetical protein LY76DRAFT_56463 [Colletotrichum caudatum]